jgi:hypothetical protein
MSRRLGLLLLIWCALAAPGPAAARLPEAAVRAFDGIDADQLRS